MLTNGHGSIIASSGLTAAVETALGKTLSFNVSTFDFLCYDLIAKTLDFTTTGEEKTQATKRTDSLPRQMPSNWILTSPQMMRKQLK